MKNNIPNTAESNRAVETEWTAGALVQKSYHEMADFPVVEVDALTQLENNMRMLEDMQSRLSFVMREVRFLMKA